MTTIETQRDAAALDQRADDVNDLQPMADEDVGGHGGPALAAGLVLAGAAGAATGVALIAGAGIVAAGVAYGVGYAQGSAESAGTSKPATTPKN